MFGTDVNMTDNTRKATTTLSDISFTQRIEHGAFVINCTENAKLGEMQILPVIDDDNIILCPGLLCRLSGPTANLLVHAWYLNVLEPLWRHLPAFDISRRKDKVHLGAVDLIVGISNMAVVGAAVKKVKYISLTYDEHLSSRAPGRMA